MEYPSPVSENDVHVAIYLWVYIVYNYSESCSRVGEVLPLQCSWVHMCADGAPQPRPPRGIFGRQRMGCGRNDNPDSNTFVNKTVSLRVQGSAALQPFRGNSQRRKRSQIQPIPVDNTPLEKRKRSSAST